MLLYLPGGNISTVHNSEWCPVISFSRAISGKAESFEVVITRSEATWRSHNSRSGDCHAPLRHGARIPLAMPAAFLDEGLGAPVSERAEHGRVHNAPHHASGS